VDKTHNPEFAMMEIQWAYADYNDVMRLTEDMYEQVAMQVLGTTKFMYGEKEIDVKAPWRRLRFVDAIKEYANLDVEKMSDHELHEATTHHHIDMEGKSSRADMITKLFEELCEKHLIQPTFIIDPLIESCPLAKPHRKDARYAERVEPYINGWEIGNGYSELTDPILQRTLLEEQVAKGRGGDAEAHPMDEDYVQALEQGLPPNAGMGLGIDRMVILMTGAESIRDVILFPIMKKVDAEDDKQ
jgi:lysyl-tRNA synthetase, class II